MDCWWVHHQWDKWFLTIVISSIFAICFYVIVISSIFQGFSYLRSTSRSTSIVVTLW
jgi:cellulose synthase/poly-beta-1,6-N-acetylglucosamine synthase-like glycosyltransferase